MGYRDIEDPAEQGATRMARGRMEPSKIVFLAVSAATVLGLAFMMGLYSGVTRNAAYSLVRTIKNDLTLVMEESPNVVGAGRPIHFLQPARHNGSGVTVNAAADDGRLILLAGMFDSKDNELRLMRRDGTVVARWPVRFSEHFPDASHLPSAPATDWNIDTHGALMRPDGSVVFNYEYGGTVKLSRCGDVEWTLAHPTHHSIEAAEGGGFWIPGRRFLGPDDPDVFPPLTTRSNNEVIEDDLILRVSEDGAIEEQVSVTEVLFDNGLKPLMTATGYNFNNWRVLNGELVHLNKIAELPSHMAPAFSGFEAGDLALSLRQRNLIFVVDPDDWRVKWHQVGPWVRQHDPEFNADGSISVFNNNTYRTALNGDDHSALDAPRVTTIMKAFPSEGVTRTVLGERQGQEMLSVIRGKLDPTPNGGTLVTEFESGRAVEFDDRGRVVWEYINRYDEEWVLEITEARSYPASFFTVDDWSCPGR
ncbi:hypothetical protein C882_1193 [Caenispirillum salinarum AK4]|uniref:Arylsulfotransferase ASST n=1 Tax=Caenispirillum salinarum AK4 TaxID=1238182 RepID=K9GSS5_9PROT|nr:arylsulfotransferase family protein [Caenispirillum salinarum]EKV28192.1 hypothetical protein C882_1193 [Caenispirillum salinarum AK4]